jgi:hypothetical protein
VVHEPVVASLPELVERAEFLLCDPAPAAPARHPLTAACTRASERVDPYCPDDRGAYNQDK